jgi:hypothetical protein
VRKVHIILFAPSIDTVEKINDKLGQIGNLKSDGRPILGLDAKELAKTVLDINEKCLVVPAHAWTPWFSVFGSKSGFDSLEECFDDYAKYIYAVETGLSADPKMFWRISAFDKIALISNSDSHSLQKIGREANVFDAELSYQSIFEILKNKDKEFVSKIINQRNYNNFTCLKYVMQNNWTDVLEELINLGADVNNFDENGKTPLIYSIETKNYNLFKLLLNNLSTDINCPDQIGESPLYHAVKKIMRNSNIDFTSKLSEEFSFLFDLLNHKNIDLNRKNNKEIVYLCSY